MQPGQFSRTALGAAGHRAAHQVLESGRVFADPLALPILGEDADSAVLSLGNEVVHYGETFRKILGLICFRPRGF